MIVDPQFAGIVAGHGHQHFAGLIEVDLGVGVIAAVGLFIRDITPDCGVLGELPTKVPSVFSFWISSGQVNSELRRMSVSPVDFSVILPRTDDVPGVDIEPTFAKAVGGDAATGKSFGFDGLEIDFLFRPVLFSKVI